MSSVTDFVDGEVACVAAGFKGAEGPVWMGDHLLFSAIHDNRIVRWEMRPEGPWVTTYRWPSGWANGNTLDRQGRLVTCEYLARRVTRTELDGTITVLADRYEGKLLNAPNDIVVKRDGAVYFTDPAGGLRFRGESMEQDISAVFRLSPDGQTLTPVIDHFEGPNGLCFSPDERLLYVINARQLFVFDVSPDGTVCNERVFAKPQGEARGNPDGMKVDTEGRVYTSGPGGIWIYDPDGTHLAVIEIPEQARNLAWGNSDLSALYITTVTALYRVRMRTQGIPLV